MKDLKYLLLLICFVTLAHATKKYSSDRTEAKFLPDVPVLKEQKKADSVMKREAANQIKIIPAASYN
ncbi:MAG TPA: hypothetical protein VMT76_07940 [Puia sp.]|nr:hypothetical protein [Puia sp.]